MNNQPNPLLAAVLWLLASIGPFIQHTKDFIYDIDYDKVDVVIVRITHCVALIASIMLLYIYRWNIRAFLLKNKSDES